MLIRNNTVLMKRSALEENAKVQILANELARRLGNTDERQERRVVGDVVDKFCQKLLTSGYSPAQTRRVTLSGLRGWERRKKRAIQERGRLFRTSEESKGGRIKKKTTGRNNWFRKRRKMTTTKPGESTITNKGSGEPVTSGRGGTPSNNSSKGDHPDTDKDDNTRIAAVMFVETTKESRQAKNLREVVERIKHIQGYTIKIVERAGTPLKLLFSLSRIGGGQECGRTECPTCTQESRGEKLPLCTKRNVLYENIYVYCAILGWGRTRS